MTEIEMLRAEVAKLTAAHATANTPVSTVAICNVCGDILAAGVDKCPKHPFDLTNHVRPATDREMNEGRGKIVLVSQS